MCRSSSDGTELHHFEKRNQLNKTNNALRPASLSKGLQLGANDPSKSSFEARQDGLLIKVENKGKVNGHFIRFNGDMISTLFTSQDEMESVIEDDIITFSDEERISNDEILFDLKNLIPKKEQLDEYFVINSKIIEAKKKVDTAFDIETTALYKSCDKIKPNPLLNYRYFLNPIVQDFQEDQDIQKTLNK